MIIDQAKNREQNADRGRRGDDEAVKFPLGALPRARTNTLLWTDHSFDISVGEKVWWVETFCRGRGVAFDETVRMPDYAEILKFLAKHPPQMTAERELHASMLELLAQCLRGSQENSTLHKDVEADMSPLHNAAAHPIN